jgi:hypothetical protein
MVHRRTDQAAVRIPSASSSHVSSQPVIAALRLVLPHAVLATGDDRTVEPAALLGTHTGRSLLAGKLSLVSVVLVGPELTKGPGHVTGHAELTCPLGRCSPPHRSRTRSRRAGR